jgi:hypothetical protein
MNHKRQIARQVIRFSTLLIFFLMVTGPARQVQALGTVFVSEDGSGTSCSQDEPCSLANGLLQVDTGGTLYAAAGTYTVESGDQVVLLQRTIDFLGGWDGAPSGPIVRDPELYESILDGENDRRVMTISDSSDVQPLVDGWTIRNGNAAELTGYGDCHAHASNALGCGGGIYVYEAQPTISHNRIMDNAAVVQSDSIVGKSGSGGGIYVDSSAGTIISGNTIRNNNSQTEGDGWGAGMYIYNSGGTTAIINNDIYENEDYDANEYHDHFGGGILIYYNNGQIRIYDNYIHNNDPLDQGYGGTAIGLQYCNNDVNIEENTITGNFGAKVIGLSYSSATIQQNTIINPGAVAGIFFNDTGLGGYEMPAQIQNNVIAGHEEYNIYNSSLLYEETYAEFIHNTLADAPYGFYIYNLGTGTISFDRGIISGHSLAGVNQTGDTKIVFTVSNTLFYDNESDGDTGTDPLLGDPRFSNPVGYDYHIQWDSAAINTVLDGGIDEDIDGDVRPYGLSATPYDVGADEFIGLKFFLPLIARP